MKRIYFFIIFCLLLSGCSAYGPQHRQYIISQTPVESQTDK